MKTIPLALIPLLIGGCAIAPVNRTTATAEAVSVASSASSAPQICPGTTQLPAALVDQFEPVEDSALLQQALGQPDKGKLCQGQVYRSKPGSQVVLYRAWNSTNPNSAKGNWWAYQVPQGMVAQYRSAYEICYQWSPLDKLDRCTLKAGVTLVVGTGQSATCSDYLTYPVSKTQQVYLENATAAVADCVTFDGEFQWKAVKPH